ncbi:D-aminoacyl-tRNA deacylase [Marispirochaeta sp.]|jgi:D-aminoacyl-tRNA deacylase|uniref:D-aminoacyl-tRNA deacylase n=1 Tax=Marispirochaeta sp. TaxID=2038653 RepID=UPI0029C6FCCC|nr:D-aminoacyl-tRNA deacylase [Marispirochaeta sp.]
MRAVVQRVKSARVEVESETVGQTGEGILVYLGVGVEDTEKDLKYLSDKVANLRVFPDESGKMNISVSEKKGGILVISQFTLFADARKGRRPSYNNAATPDKARTLYEGFVNSLKEKGLTVATGIFQARMNVISLNDGPVTILLDSHKQF